MGTAHLLHEFFRDCAASYCEADSGKRSDCDFDGRTETTLAFLPFLGEERTVTGEAAGEQVTFHLPAFDRGAVVWVNESK